MRRTLCLFVFLLLSMTDLALAQDTPAAPQPVTPAPLFSTPAATVVPSTGDSRLASCAAPTLPNFVPYTVRLGDASLADLLMGSSTVTPAQLAALNCLDDAQFPPVGATLWLPADAFVVAGAAASANEAIAETASTAPQITSFAADAESVLNDQGLTLSWQAQGQTAYLYLCPTPPEAGCSRPRTAGPLPLMGSMTIGSFWRANPVRFRLEVVGGDSANRPITQDVTVEVTCAQQWLGGAGTSPTCPEDPARTVTAVWQPFQGGVMMWFSDTRQIYVMTNADGRVSVYTDPYVEGMADPTAAAPEGLFTPVRGFGQIWQALGGAESSGLGWAMAAEIGFDSARQPAGRTSYTTYVQGPGATVYAITEVPSMDGGYWTQVAG
jgi:hypothetical protein